MTQKDADDQNDPSAEAVIKPERILSPAAQRALDEAKARRETIDAKTTSSPKELGGRGGLDPARYGDWEVKGISSDF